MLNTTFQVTNNRLHRNSFVHTLHVENDYYKIKLHYSNDYETDLKNKTLKSSDLLISCKLKQMTIPLTYFNGAIYVEDDMPVFRTADKIQEYQNQLEIAKQSAIELQKIVDEYFPNIQTTK